MKMNLSLMMFLLFMILSTMMTMSSNNILFSWMNMEMNFIMFLPMMTKSSKLTDQTMKYFIIQSSSSSIMLISILMNTILETPMELSISLMMSLMMKMGIMPLHLWMPNLMQNLSWMNCLLMTTWQKIIPTIMTAQMLKMEMLTMPLILSLILSPISGMKQLSTKKIMAYSSISNSTWMVFSIFLSNQMFIMFMTIYSMINSMIIWTFKKMNMNYLNQMKSMKMIQKINLMLMFLSISGMPPLMGFLPKWMILQSMMKYSIMMSMMMILSSMISTYMYMKIFPSIFTMLSSKKKLIYHSSSMIMITINIMGLTAMSMFMKINC